MIDLADFDKLNKYRWCLKHLPQYEGDITGLYATTTIYCGCVNGKSKNDVYQLGKILLDIPKGRHVIVDHINHNTLDNRRFNLRVIYQSENLSHRKGCNKNNKSGYRNVSWITKDKRWWVQFQVNGKSKLLGRFRYKELDKAIELANKLRAEIYKEFSGNS